jgi:arylsulfatase A
VPDRREGVPRQQDPYGWYREGPIAPDFMIPEILAALDEAEIAEHTLVIFTSDNGCSPEANFDLLRQHGHDPSAGFRGHKADISEGGHRVPLVVRWPAVIEGGRTTAAVACLTDFYPTLAEVAGVRRPPELPGGEDGWSLGTVFRRDEVTGRETLVSHSVDGSFAIRHGRWKLCLCGGSGGWSEPKEPEAKRRSLPPVQLYDLEADPAETTNLQADHPEIVADLIARLSAEVRRGRSTPGPDLANDRDVSFLPPGFPAGPQRLGR